MSFKGKQCLLPVLPVESGKRWDSNLQKGANVVVAAKVWKKIQNWAVPFFTAADEMTAAGGQGIGDSARYPLWRSDTGCYKKKTVAFFGGIDILINNASAINLTPTGANKNRSVLIWCMISMYVVCFLWHVPVSYIYAKEKSAYTYLITSCKPETKMAGRTYCLYRYQV